MNTPVMEVWIILGLVAGLFTTVGFLPQIVRGYTTKRMGDVSLYMPMLLSVGMALWLCYGVVLDNMPIIFWNAVALLLNLIIGKRKGMNDLRI
jgi:MtN3 and saliva related transmembrane protein